MVTRRRKIARSAICRVKRNNASKNIRHKLKTHRRKHRKIIMRGGGEDSYSIFVYSINIKDVRANRKKVKCILVQKKVSGAKDDLFFFWPSYVTIKELNATLSLFIVQDKVQGVSSIVLPEELTLNPTDNMFLSSYLKVQPLPKKSSFEVSRYNPTISVDDMNTPTVTVGAGEQKQEEVSTAKLVDEALKDDFDREALKYSLLTISTNKPVAIEFKGEYKDLISKVKELMKQYSSEYKDSLCSQSAVKKLNVSSGWCLKN